VKRRFRLSRSNDIQRVRRAGRSYAHPLLVLLAASTPSSKTQAAIITGHRIGFAVQRNRIKRQIRACLDKLLPDLPDGWHLVVLARQSIIQADFAEIDRALRSVLKRAGLTVEVKADDGRNP
jgi:ribonuclease P protein component